MHNPILEQFKQVLEKFGLSKREQDQVLLQLTRAVAGRMVIELEKQLDQEQKMRLQQRKPQSLAELVTAYEKVVPNQQIQVALQESTKVVIKKFLEATKKIKNNN